MAQKGKDEKGTEAQAPAAEAAAPAKQGAAVILPNGERRVDYIRNNYYSPEPPYEHTDQQKTRSEIKNAINEMYKNAGDAKQIAYQIVFANTRDKVDPRKLQKGSAPAEGGQTAAATA